MEKKVLIPIIAVVVILLAGIAYLGTRFWQEKQNNDQMLELAQLDKQEMESEYQQFANQYSEMKSQITNDSIIAQLTKEQERTQQLLEELKNVKSSDAREITRLKKELATCRAVIRSYVLEIDSLNRLNQNLRAENTQIRTQYNEASRQIEGLNSEKASLSEKVAIAAQLDATGLSLSMLDKKGKSCKKLSKCKKLQMSFTIAKNVTAQSGTKQVYVRITAPTGETLGGGGSFRYENKSLQATARKSIDYGGQEQSVTMYWEVSQSLEAGTYQMSIFADGNMIGSKSVNLK